MSLAINKKGKLCNNNNLQELKPSLAGTTFTFQNQQFNLTFPP